MKCITPVHGAIEVIPKEKIKDALKDHKEILVAYLYGSTVKGYDNKKSDVDVGLLLKENCKTEALYPAQIARKIKEKCGITRDVDVRILNKRPYRFLHQVIKEGQIIFSRDERERVKFEAYVTDRYIDFKPFYEQYDEKRSERLLTSA